MLGSFNCQYETVWRVVVVYTEPLNRFFCKLWPC